MASGERDRPGPRESTIKGMSMSNVMLWLQGVLDKIRLKIQKLEKAILSQREACKEPCKTKCPIPVVSGKCDEDGYCATGDICTIQTHTPIQTQLRVIDGCCPS